MAARSVGGSTVATYGFINSAGENIGGETGALLHSNIQGDNSEINGNSKVKSIA